MMKLKIPKLLDRVISQRRGSRNQAALSTLEYSQSPSEDKAAATKSDDQILSPALITVQEERPTISTTASASPPDGFQEQQSAPVLLSPPNKNSPEPHVLTSPVIENSPIDRESVVDATTDHPVKRLSSKDNDRFFPESVPSDAGVKLYIASRDLHSIKAGLPGTKHQPLVRRNALRGRPMMRPTSTGPGQTSLDMIEFPVYPVSHQIPSAAIKSPTDLNFQIQDEIEDKNNQLDDLCSREPFCITCQAIIRKFPKVDWYTQVASTTQSLQIRSSQDCPLCSLYLELVVSKANHEFDADLKNRNSNEISVEPLINSPESGDLIYKRDSGSKLALHYLSKKYTVVLDWKYSSVSFLSERWLSPERWVLSQESLYSSYFSNSWVVAQTWLQACVQHPSCRANRNRSYFLPTRLLQICGGTGEFPLAINLCYGSEVGLAVKYMTLSHCWGKANHITLVKGNLASLQERINFEHLPKTFQDSVLVTRYLGIRYLWIDSLCIIQDSAEDWRRESILMGDVYSSSFCNISAAAAVDGSAGLFLNQDLSNFRITKLNMRENQLAPPRTCYAHDSEFFIKSIDEGPLAKRGWVLQERLLSRCNLHFGKNQVLWECCEQNACEMMPDGLAPGISRPLMKDTISIMRQLQPLHIHGDRVDLWAYGRWANIIQTYTEALLTRHSDRLVAISGLAAIFQEFYGKHYLVRLEYLAGLWGDRAHLATQLLWHPKKVRSVPASSSAFVAPTWSWASIDASIEDVFNFSRTSVEMVTFAFQYASIALVGDHDLFGQVSSGALTVKGKLARVSYTALPAATPQGIELPPHGILKMQEYRPLEDFSWYTSDMESSNVIQTKVWWDRTLSPGSTVASGRLFLLPIRAEDLEEENFMEGLILETVDSRTSTTTRSSKTPSLVPSKFRRVGKWTACNYASVLRVRAGCRFFDMRSQKEKGGKDPLQNDYEVWRGKTYTINII